MKLSCLFCAILVLTFSIIHGEKDFYELLGVSKQATLREIRKAFKKIAVSEHPDKKKDDPYANEKFIRINRAYEVLKDEDLRKKYDMYGEDGLKEDGPSGRGFKSWNFYRNEFGIYDNDDEIITLSNSDFEASVTNSDDPWFINYYSPNCGHCHELAPAWREMARELDGVIRIGAVNCQDDWMLCRGQGIRSYPSLLMYPQREKYYGDRTVREMVSYALKQVRARVHELWSGNFQDKLRDERQLPWLITYCGDGGDCLTRMTLTKLSVMLNELVNIGIVDCHTKESLCEEQGVDAGTYYYPAGGVAKGGGAEITSLDCKEVAFSVLGQLPDVTELNKEEFQKTLDEVRSGSDSPWLIHFVEGADHDLELRKLPALLSDMRVGRVDCQTSRGLCNELHVHKFPAFAVFKSGGGHEFHHGRQIAHDIANFAKDSAGTPVRVLGPADFPDPVTNGNQPWFVDFYAPWCPPCMRLLPEFRKASKEMTSVSFGTVDCTIHSALCNRFNIRSYPTTIFYNQSVPHQFHGNHGKNDLIEFLQDTLSPPVIILDDTSFDESVLRRDRDVIWLVDYYAPWCGPCQQLAPEWRRLAKMLRSMDNIRVAQVDCDAQRGLCQTQGVRSYPSVRLYPSTSSHSASTYYMYNGWFRDAQSLRAWAFEFLPSKSTNLDWNMFQSQVVSGEDPWIVDFFAPWCGHCQVFAPEFERVARTMEGRVHAGKVDCDQESFLCQQAGIRAYPSVRFYKGAPQGWKQSIYGEDLNSQDADYIIRFLKQKAPEKHIKDEL